MRFLSSLALSYRARQKGGAVLAVIAGLLVVAAGDNVVRLLPPLVISEADVAEAVSRLDKAANAVEASLKRPAAE